jgi:hypothetical protein
MKMKITLTLFALLCALGMTQSLEAQTKPIGELLERLEQVGDYHGSINDFFTQEEQLQLKAHFSANRDISLSDKDRERGSGVAAWCAMNSTGEFGTFDPANGSTVTAVGVSPIGGDVFENAGAINPSDLNEAWVLANNGDAYTVDVATGTYTLIGSVGNDWVAAEFDQSTGLFYALDGLGDLYNVDVPGLTANLVGSTGLGAVLPIGLAIDGESNAYTYSLGDDNFYSIDLGTAASTLVGSIGFNANFGQGMFWNSATDTIIMTAFNGDLFDSELRSVDTTTGATTLINQMDPAALTQYAWSSSPASTPPPPPPPCTVFEDFEEGLPAGWSTVVNTGDCDWAVQSATPTGDDFPTLAMVFDDDACGNGAPASNVSLLSDVYDTSAANSILIGYDVAFQNVGSTDSFTVEVWDGAAWQQIAFYDTDLDPDIQTEVDIDVTEFANADFQVRWTYDDAGEWAWHAGVDNFCMNLGFPDPANVQVIHNSPDPAGEFVDVYVNGVLAIDDFEFRTATPFLELPSGVSLSIDVAGASSGVLGDTLNPDDSLFNLTTTLDEGENYLLVANGVLDPGAFATDNAFDLTVYAGARTVADDPALVDVLVHHGSPDAPAVDVNETGAGNLVSNIAYPEFQGYLSLPAENYVLEVAAAGSPDALVTYQAPLAALGGFEGDAVTVVASGFFGEDAGDTNGFGLWVATAGGGPLLELPLLPDPPAECTVFEGFESGLPAGWSTVVNTGDCDWANQSETPFGDDFPTLAMVFDDDACGNGAPASNVSLLSDVYDTTGATSILVGYDVSFIEVGDGESLTVEVWDGTEWQQIAFYDAAFLDQNIQTESGVDATAFANADFQVRWTYDDAGTWGWHAGIDNFCMKLNFSAFANAQVIHNSPDPAAELVDVYINDVLELNDVAFRTATPFLQLPSGVSLSIDIAGAASGDLGDPLNPDDSLFNLTTTLDEGENYILVANGVLDPGAFATDNAFDLTVYAGARTVADDPSLIDVLVHHGSPDAPAVDVNEPGAGNLVSNIAYPEFQGYLSLPSENYVLEIAAAGSPDALVAYQAPLAALGGFEGAAITVIASGFFGEDAGETNGFGLWVASAAGGPLLELPLLPEPPEECTVFEGFESGLPTGWSTVVNTGDCDWANQSETPTGDDFPTLAMVFDDDACGSEASASNVSLLSDVYDTSGATSILISYDVAFQEVASGDSLTVEVWDGAEWQQIAFYDADLDPDIQTEEDLDATAFANADFQVRWTYDDAGAWAWHAGVDSFCMKLNTFGTNDNEIAGFEYYPNPADNLLNLSARTNIDSVIIYNILGQKVIDQNVNSMSTALDVSTLSSGTYIMRVTAEGQVASYKVIKR